MGATQSASLHTGFAWCRLLPKAQIRWPSTHDCRIGRSRPSCRFQKRATAAISCNRPSTIARTFPKTSIERLSTQQPLLNCPRTPEFEHFELTEQNDAEQFWAVRRQAYTRLGTFLLGQIDILVAVWDGEPEEGAGGTGEVVRGALDAGIPVVWISTIVPLPPRMIKQIDENSHPVAPPADALQGQLKDAISVIVSKPRANPYDASHVRAPDG